MARRSGQPFLDLLRWHPRDVDTWWQMDIDDAEAAQEQDRDARFAAATAELRQRMGR
ncbi:MAG TPA: hypothetical protein VFM50_02865 [Nocardioidaceae bacterium]|nr:hypothetical protein [Nocardioidaceae bacterium]